MYEEDLLWLERELERELESKLEIQLEGIL